MGAGISLSEMPAYLGSMFTRKKRRNKRAEPPGLQRLCVCEKPRVRFFRCTMRLAELTKRTRVWNAKAALPRFPHARAPGSSQRGRHRAFPQRGLPCLWRRDGGMNGQHGGRGSSGVSDEPWSRSWFRSRFRSPAAPVRSALL